MGFNRINRTCEVFKTEVFDSCGNKLARWVCEKEDYPNTINILSDKFGLGIKVVRREKTDYNKDLDWIK